MSREKIPYNKNIALNWKTFEFRFKFYHNSNSQYFQRITDLFINTVFYYFRSSGFDKSL